MTIHLLLNQKHVVRVKPNILLADLFQMGVQHRRLDPGRHELRHPAVPDMALDMESPLSRYGIVEVLIVELEKNSQHRGRFIWLLLTTGIGEGVHCSLSAVDSAPCGKSHAVWDHSFIRHLAEEGSAYCTNVVFVLHGKL